MTPTVIVHPMESLAAAGKGLAQALSLARCHGAQLHVVYVPPGRGGSAGEASRLTERLHEVVAAMATAARAPRVVAAVLHGHPVQALGTYAREKSADLVVLERPRPPGRYWSAGGLAGALGRAAGCPVLAVPAAGEARERPLDGMFRRIVSAVDFSDASASALHHALKLAQDSGGRITLLHVLEGFPDEAIASPALRPVFASDYSASVSRVNRALEHLVPAEARAWCDVRVETVPGCAADAIVRTAQRRAADLVVLGSSLQTMRDRPVAGSAAGGVLRRASCPVLIVPGSLDASPGFTVPSGWHGRASDPAETGLALAPG